MSYQVPRVCGIVSAVVELPDDLQLLFRRKSS